MKKIISATLATFMSISLLPVIGYGARVNINEDFNSYDAGAELSELNLDWAVVSASNEGDSVTIENDGQNNRAVKITQTKGSTHSTGFKVDLGTINSGVVNLSFKIKSDCVNAHLQNEWVSGMREDTGTAVIDVKTYDAGLWVNNVGGTWLDSLNSSTYKEFKIVVDLNEKNSKINNKVSRKDLKSAKSLNFLISGNTNPNGRMLKGENNPVYWIDDIKVEHLKFGLESTIPADKAESVDINSDITATFNANVDAVSPGVNVKAYANGSELGADKFTATANGKNIVVDICEGMEYNTAYKVEFLENITGAIGTLEEKKTMEFTTKRLFPAMVNLENGGEYAEIKPQLPAIDGDVEFSAKLKHPNNEEKDFDPDEILTTEGDYTLTLTGTDQNGKSQVDIYSFKVVGAQPPEARNIKIVVEGELNENSVLKGEYEYYDVNKEDKQDFEKTGFKWYSSDTIDGEYKEISGATEQTYPLESTDVNKYFKFAVIPVSLNEPYGEKEFKMEKGFAGYFEPVAKDVKLDGKMILDGELTASCSIFDENGSTQLDKVFVWYKSTDNGVSWNEISRGNSDKYKITQADKDCMLKVGVTPSKPTGTGKEECSEPIDGLMSPTVSDVKIKGNAKVGETIYASYVYADKNDEDDEGATIIQWYVDGKAYSQGESIELNKSMAGKSIYAEVTPVSVNFPYEGEAVKSDSVGVSKKSSSGGGGGSGSASSVFISSAKPEVEQEEKPTTEQDEKSEAIIFNDIEAHWAKADILEMYEKGIINGVGENKFLPNASVTRAQFAKMIVKVFADLPENDVEDFSDVDAGKWYYEDVKKAAAKGLMSGYDGYFRPEENITREEICVVISNALNQKSDGENINFEDADEISLWAREAVGFASQMGIVNGSDGKFYPKADATRAESIVMLKRVMNLMEVDNEK